jgi:hypothetical protein
MPALLVFDTNVVMDIWLGRDGDEAVLLLTLAENRRVDLVVPDFVLIEFQGTARLISQGIGGNELALVSVPGRTMNGSDPMLLPPAAPENAPTTTKRALPASDAPAAPVVGIGRFTNATMPDWSVAMAVVVGTPATR